MKKSLVLGVAALAAVMMVTPEQSEAAEIKVGGYYMFRIQDEDYSPTDITGEDDLSRYVHRLQVNADFIHDKKTHAHLQTRILDSKTVEGLNGNAGGFAEKDNLTTDGNGDWSIRAAWLETEMWGVGLKVGQMPLSFNDNILISTQSTGKSFGTLMLSKNFGGVTAILANIKVDEGNSEGESVNDEYEDDNALNEDNDTDAPVDTDTFSGTAYDQNYGADEDDVDIYLLSLLGKLGKVDYNFTGAYLQTGDDPTVPPDYIIDALSDYEVDSLMNDGLRGQDASNFWLALTLQGEVGGVTATGTAIYEDGYEVGNFEEEDGALFALRLKGKSPIGKWNVYGFWADEDFNNITNRDMKWSKAWDMGGPGSKDLLNEWAKDTAAGGSGASDSENMSGIGAGLKIKAGAWTINPQLDYAAVDQEQAGYTDSAWGGTLALSTKINKSTSFGITGVYVDPDGGNAWVSGSTADGNLVINEVDSMHYVEAHVKMKF